MSSRMTLHVDNDSTMYLSSPDDEFKKTKMTKGMVVDSFVSFHWKRIGLNFDGIYYPDGDSISGVMSQSSLKWHALFTRELREVSKPKRPQEPSDEVDYYSQDLTIKNGDITLGATLTMPKEYDSNTPIVVLASGSGPQDRNCELMGHKPFLVIADYFARHGVGCLRFDDRGTGSSTGVYSESTLEDFASDVLACFNHLKNDPKFADNPIGLAGHSEGGMHTLMAAKNNKDIDFVIQLASVGTTGRDVLIEQQYLIPKQAGETEEQALWNKAVFEGMCDYVAKYDQKQAADSLAVFLDKMFAIAPEKYKEESSKFQFIIGMNSFINNAWARQFIQFKTEDYLKGLKAPLLTINGEKDIQVPPISNSEGFKTFHYKRKLRKKNKFVIAPGLNHLMQHCNTCTVMEYGDLEETFSEKVMQEMVDWLTCLKD